MQVSKGGAVQGTILILDGVSTNRIMLKVQLSAAWYHVVQGDGLAGVLPLVRRSRPDLIVTSMSLPDGTAPQLRALLARDSEFDTIPIIAITAQNDRAATLRALAAGVDDVLAHPLDDVMLQARIRSLLRTRSAAEDLRQQDKASHMLGLAEPAARFAAAPPRVGDVALVTLSAATGALWQTQLKNRGEFTVRAYSLDDVPAMMARPVPDAIVVELGTGDPATNRAGLHLLADLQARSATRHTAIIAVPVPADTRLAAEALDRGAHDVLQAGFCADELALRLVAQMRHKARADQLRDTVRDGLRAAVLDPMTGLHNRRYALPHLSRTARRAAEDGSSFAVMLADLDHFKRINDRYGHPVGDSVLIETARRLKTELRPEDMIARVGGEEFMIVMPATGPAAALDAAGRLCARIGARPFTVPGTNRTLPVTTSIGVTIAAPLATGLTMRGDLPGARKTEQPCQHLDDSSGAARGMLTCEPRVVALIDTADRALYGAKDAGRNRVNLIRAAPETSPPAPPGPAS